MADLERRGAVFVEELDTVPDGATVVFSAHGEWFVVTGPGVNLGVPIGAESRMLKHEWHP